MVHISVKLYIQLYKVKLLFIHYMLSVDGLFFEMIQI